MIMAGAEDGSVVRIHIQQVYLRYSSLLPVTEASVAVPAIEAAAVTIGLQDRAAALPTTSASTAAMSACTTAPVPTGTLSVASRNNGGEGSQLFSYSLRTGLCDLQRRDL